MEERAYQFWVALIAAVLLVVERNKDKALLSRVLIAAVSGGMGYALAGEAATLTGRSETLAVMLVTAFGYLVIDIISSLVADRAFVKRIILKKLGGKPEDE